MNIVSNKQNVSRDRLLAIFFFKKEDAPFMSMGDSWDAAAAAIDQDDDPDDGYFVGFHDIVGAKVDEIPSVFNETLTEKINIWSREINMELMLSGQPKIDLSKVDVFYTKYHDNNKNYSWGIAYLMH